MTNKPAITVFMAVFNGESYLRQSIDSILSQTFSDFELLIINDGSSDNSRDIIKGYSDPRIRLLENDVNKGLVYTRNRGVLEARGEYYAILDCDDIATIDRLQIQYNFFCKNPEIALCSGRALYIDKNNVPVRESPKIIGNKNLLLIFGNILINSAVMIRTEAIKAVGSYIAHSPAEDYDLAMRISEKYPIAVVDDILVRYRVHGNNVSMADLGYLKQVEKNIFRDFHSRLKIKSDERRIELHHSLISGNINDFTVVEYDEFLVDLMQRLIEKNNYNPYELRKFLFEKWFTVILLIGGKKAFPLLFQSQLYTPSIVTFRQLRKTFKKSVKELLFN